jgi:type VI secretion system protein VasD
VTAWDGQMMSRRRARFVYGVMIAAMVWAIGCAKAPPPAPPPAAAPVITIAAPPETKFKAVMTIAVSPDANPDTNGRPSPVVVHVYQLRADAAFKAAEFFALIDDAAKVLGPSLITSDEFFMQTPDTRTVDVTVANEASFLGVVAEYRQFRNAEWRALVPAPRQGMRISVEKARVQVTATQ